MAPRKGKKEKEEQVISLGPQVCNTFCCQKYSYVNVVHHLHIELRGLSKIAPEKFACRYFMFQVPKEGN